MQATIMLEKLSNQNPWKENGKSVKNLWPDPPTHGAPDRVWLSVYLHPVQLPPIWPLMVHSEGEVRCRGGLGEVVVEAALQLMPSSVVINHTLIEVAAVKITNIYHWAAGLRSTSTDLQVHLAWTHKIYRVRTYNEEENYHQTLGVKINWADTKWAETQILNTKVKLNKQTKM